MRKKSYTHHSLSRLLQGFLPVAASKMTHPIAHISIDPGLPGRSFLIISGDMYIGVPVKLFPATPLESIIARVRCRVRFLTMILEAPKSTNFMTPL